MKNPYHHVIYYIDVHASGTTTSSITHRPKFQPYHHTVIHHLHYSYSSIIFETTSRLPIVNQSSCHHSLLQLYTQIIISFTTLTHPSCTATSSIVHSSSIHHQSTYSLHHSSILPFIHTIITSFIHTIIVI